MGQSMSTLDFFLIEGNDHLEQLDALAQHPAGTFLKGDDLLRISRAFRGSAMMGGQMGLAHAGQGLEACARAIREGRLEWNEATRAEVVRAIDDCKVLMRRLKAPEAGDADRAAAIGVQLEKLSGRATAAMRAAGGLDAGSRAFVAREAASIASVLQQVARAVRSDPSGREALSSIAPVMSALRGVAILSDLPPLGDVLAAIDAAAKDASGTSGAPLPQTADLLESAAKALARAAREVVDAGRPEAASEEARSFAAALLASLRGATVGVESLFYDDAGPHIVRRGAVPAGAGLERADMVSHGEFLHAAAAELSRATMPIQRDLRLYAIAAGLSPMMSAGGTPLATALGGLALAARDAIAGGSASSAPEAFAGHVRTAAEALTSQNAGEAQLAERVNQAAQALGRLAGPETRAEARARPEPALKGGPSGPADAERGLQSASAPVLGEADLAASYLTFEQLIAERGLPMGTLDELLAGVTGMPGGARTPAAASPRGPASAPRGPRGTRPMTAADEAKVVPVESLAPDEAGIVPVESLLYHGDAALDRALQLRGELAAASGERLTALIREVFDLVELGRGAGR